MASKGSATLRSTPPQIAVTTSPSGGEILELESKTAQAGNSARLGIVIFDTITQQYPLFALYGWPFIIILLRSDTANSYH